MVKKLIVENIYKSYGEKVLFDHISLTINDKDRIGLLGINGTGKSTLLKIIAAIEEQDSGEIHTSKDYTIAYLSQQPIIDEEATVLAQVFSGDNPLIQLQLKYEQALLALEQDPLNEDVQDTFYNLQQEMEATHAWDANIQIKAMLNKLGIHDLSQQMKHLSGGQQKRVAMASCFAQLPDLLILDEPTNHLDYDTIEWLEQYLMRYPGSLLFVTHDRYFLDRITNRILELEDGQLYSYSGNYSKFLEKKAEREDHLLANEEKRQNLFKKELEWIRKGARARTTKQKARIDRFEALQEGGLKQKGQIDITLANKRLGKKVLELDNISKSFGDKIILKHFTYIVGPKSRIGIIGKNGSGKSTLLNMLAGRVKPDSGKIDHGATIKIAYYTQETEEMNPNQRMIEYIRDAANMIHTNDGKTISASVMLERFLFPTFMHKLPIEKLSGGERRRLFLLKLLMTEPNLLFLDEPTNDFDTQTLTILEEYLENFPGVLITISHDRYFLDKVVDELIFLEGDGQVKTDRGAYTDFLEKQKAMLLTTVNQEEKIVKPIEKGTKQKRKLSYNEQKEWDVIEDEILELEDKLILINSDLNTIGGDFMRAQELVVEKEALENELDVKMNRWEELSELIASFEV